MVTIEHSTLETIFIQLDNLCNYIPLFKNYIPATMNVGPCHHGMVRPQVADGGTASYMEGSCE
jgi:hypothetical protein